MKHVATMFVWLKRGLLFLGVLLAVLWAVLYFWSVSIAEIVLSPHLEARGGQLELESIRVGFSGAELRVERYEEANILLEGLRVICPWSQLWSSGNGFEGSLEAKRVVLRAETNTPQEGASEPFSPEALAETLAKVFDDLPLQAVDVAVDDLVIEVRDQVFHFELKSDLLRGAGGETHLAATLRGEAVEMDARIKVSTGGKGLALNFALSAGKWDDFRKTYLRPLSEGWAAAGMEVYIDSLGSERGFLDVSGYARWEATQPEKLSFVALADFGASEVYLPSGELILKAASAGLALDGAGHQRVYAKGGIDSLRVGSFIQSGGDWALRLESDRLAGELRVGEAVSLSFEHENWQQLLGGAGAGRFYLESSAIDAGLLRALRVPQLPDDLSLDLAIRVEGEGTLEEWQPVRGQIDIDASLKQASLTSKGVSIVNAEAEGSLKVSGARMVSGSMDLSLESLDVVGFVFEQLKIRAAADTNGLIAVQPVQADFMGGGLRIEAMQVDPQNLGELSFKAHLDAVNLSQLAAAVPQFKGEISGKASGYLLGAFRDGLPILTDGRLEVDPEQGARLRYDVNGLLTRGMPENSAAYKQYRMAELAFQDLALKQFSIDVFPDGNTAQPFRLKLFGESLQGNTVVPVDFNLNVNVDDTAGLLELLRMIQNGELDLN